LQFGNKQFPVYMSKMANNITWFDQLMMTVTFAEAGVTELPAGAVEQPAVKTAGYQRLRRSGSKYMRRFLPKIA